MQKTIPILTSLLPTLYIIHLELCLSLGTMCQLPLRSHGSCSFLFNCISPQRWKSPFERYVLHSEGIYTGCSKSHSPSSPTRNPIWNEIPHRKKTNLKVYLSLMTSQMNGQSNSKQRRLIRIGHRFKRGWMEQAIGDQLPAFYGRRENGLFSMFTPTYDHIANYKSPDSNLPDCRRVYSIKQFIYIYSINQIFD